MRIPGGILETVVFLYPTLEDLEKNEGLGGSGFLVKVASSIPGGYFQYVVTNRHLIDEKDGEPCLVVSLNLWGGGRRGIETRREDWKLADDDDLAVCLITEDPYEYQLASLFEGFLLTPDLIKTWDVGLGDQVVMTGRFVLHQGERRMLPAARFGNIAMMPHEPLFDAHYRRYIDAFLVELHSIPGFSGSPVFVYKPIGSPKFNTEGDIVHLHAKDTMLLLGIQSEHFLDELTVMDMKGKRPSSKDEKHPSFYVEDPTGLSVVIPAWNLLNLLYRPDIAAERERRERIEMENREKERERRKGGGLKPQSRTPYPDSGFTPGLQRTLKRKFDESEIDEVDEDAFLGAMRQAAPPESPPEPDDEA